MEFLPIVATAIIVFIVGVIFLIQGPPFVPSNDEFTKNAVLEIKKLHPKPKKILDMGSGDGKLVIALAEAGFHADGVELNPKLVVQSRRSIQKKKFKNRAIIVWGNFWSYDTSSYDVIVLYVIKHIMPKLEVKLLKELHKGSYIISNYFVFPHLKPIRDDKRTKVYKV